MSPAGGDGIRDATQVDTQAVSAFDVEKARVERAFSLQLGDLGNGQRPTGWK